VYYYSRQPADIYDEWDCDSCPAADRVTAGDETAAIAHVKDTGHSVTIIHTYASRLVGYTSEIAASAG